MIKIAPPQRSGFSTVFVVEEARLSTESYSPKSQDDMRSCVGIALSDCRERSSKSFSIVGHIAIIFQKSHRRLMISFATFALAHFHTMNTARIFSLDPSSAMADGTMEG